MSPRPDRTQTPVYLSEAERAYASMIGDLVPGRSFGVAGGVRFAIRHCRSCVGAEPVAILDAIQAESSHAGPEGDQSR